MGQTAREWITKALPPGNHCHHKSIAITKSLVILSAAKDLLLPAA
jgi:hypothetical protein